MKSTFIYVFTLVLVITTQTAHAGFFSSLVKVISHIPIIGNIVDQYADKVAHKKVDSKINSLYQSAIACSPLETDGTSTVKDFIIMKPGYPGWQTLEKLEGVARDAASTAKTKSASDKVQHCFAGCIVRKNLGYSAAVLTAFLKEMQDASDCQSSTHFEIQDYYATVAGAEAGGKTSCESFCGKMGTPALSGSQLLQQARELVVPQSRYSALSRYNMHMQLQ